MSKEDKVMIYIRTTDGEIMEHKNSNVVMKEKEFEDCLKNHNLVVVENYANTIEELCDFSYALWKDNTFEVYDLSFHKSIKKKELAKYLKDGDVLEVYYGIKTNRGLIFVAKMNEKGELELL